MKNNYKYIAFDADDTLWINETFFRDTEEKFAKIFNHIETENKIQQELFKMEIKNIPLYGYGIKGFVLSMIECATQLSPSPLSNSILNTILDFGKEMINAPVDLLPNVKETISELSENHKLIVATKGDLLDQERKLEKSGLLNYFHHIEVMSEKTSTDYQKLLYHLDCKAEDFLMIGNSLKSDVLPVLKLNGNAIHIPFHTTWAHETVSQKEQENAEYLTLKNIKEILPLLSL